MSSFTLAELETIVAARAAAPAAESYTAASLAKGPVHCAKKFGEEAVEAVIAATEGAKAPLVAESADVLFHLMLVWKSSGIALDEVMAELERRTVQSGHAEKASRPGPILEGTHEMNERPMPVSLAAAAAMPQANGDASPYRMFSRAEWAAKRADTPMTLTPEEVTKLKSFTDQLSIEEVEAIYLPISRLLSFYVAAQQKLSRASQSFLGAKDVKIPFVIGVAGSVAVGKSTTSRVLQALLSRWSNTPKVDLVTTDGFLFPNAHLEREGLMKKKGFPESYDTKALLRFLAAVKAGERHVTAPVYSHLVYDVVPGGGVTVDRPDILIVEGLNVLLTGRPPRDGKAIPFVSDYFDFSIFIDAEEEVLERWYLERFMRLRETAFRDPQSYFRRYAEKSEFEAMKTALALWYGINLVNLRDNILPTRHRAKLILKKARDHKIESVSLRRV